MQARVIVYANPDAAISILVHKIKIVLLQAQDIQLAKLDAAKIQNADRLRNAFQLEVAILYVNQDATLIMTIAAKEELAHQQEKDIKHAFDEMIQKTFKY